MADDSRPEQAEEVPNPMTGMVVTGEAEIIRGGQVVTDDEGND